MAKKTTKSNKTSHVMNLLTSAPVTEEVEGVDSVEEKPPSGRKKSAKGEIDAALPSVFL